MENFYRAAVIGCGRMGAFTSESVIQHAPACWLPLNHAEAISRHPKLRLEALCDLNTENLARAGAVHAQARTYDDPHHLLAQERPALLGLATRTLGRADIIQAALACGTRAIHAEKPLCNSMAELQALQMVLMPANEDVYFSWGAVRRFFPVYRQALALATSGRWGKLREVRVSMGLAPLFWTHPHSIDLLLFAAAGRPVLGVQARLQDVVFGDLPTQVDSDPKVELASVYFEGGLVGLIGQSLGSDVTLSCEQGEITVAADGARLTLYAAGEGVYPVASNLIIEPSALPGGTLGPVSQLVACLQGDADSIQANTALRHDILMAQSITFGMLQSHLEGSRIVDLACIDPTLCILAKTAGRFA